MLTQLEGPEARNITAQGVALGENPEENQGLKARHTPDAPHPASETWNCLLDGHPVPFINADLTTGSNTVSALPLIENEGIAFQGPVKVGHFEMDGDTARKMLAEPTNPNGKPNSDVIVPWINAKDLTGRAKGNYIVDFGSEMLEHEAALYQHPFEYIRHHVMPERLKNNRPRRRDLWWRHGETNKGMRSALAGLNRYIASPRVATYRLFTWQQAGTLADSRILVIARQDDYFFGILHSQLHEIWSFATSSRHGVGNDPTYNAETCFDTFPFPYPPGTEPSEAESPIVRAIAEAARTLVQLRDNWLNPPNTPESDLKKRTLTNLYNQRPTWLDNAHRQLDEAVFAAYGWPPNLTTQQILANLLALNQERAAAQPPATKPRKKSAHQA